MSVISSQFVVTVFEDGTTHMFSNGCKVDDRAMELIQTVLETLDRLYPQPTVEQTASEIKTSESGKETTT